MRLWNVVTMRTSLRKRTTRCSRPPRPPRARGRRSRSWPSESAADFPLDRGETLELHLYLNQSLFLPLKVQVARIEGKGAIRRVGGEFKERSGKTFKAYKAFLEMLDLLVEAGSLNSPASG